MNKRQRDANRATAILARYALNPNTWSDQKVHTLTLADLPVDLRAVIFGVRDETPRTIPLLTEGEGDMLRVLDGRWASTMNSLTGDGNAVFERAASGSVWVASACGTEGKVFEKPAVPLPVTSDQWFADALDSLWMADSIDKQNAAIRLALSNRLAEHGWRGNPSPCWSESTRIAYCRQQGLPLNTPEETCRRLQRYGFLVSYAARNDAEQAEMEILRAALLADGIDPGWEEVPRRETTEEDLAVFQIRKERPWHS